MSASSFLARGGFRPTAVVLALVAAMVAGGISVRPAPADDASIAADDRPADTQPGEKSLEESAEEEQENLSGKHWACFDAALRCGSPAAAGGQPVADASRLAAGVAAAAAPIRGPPAVA